MLMKSCFVFAGLLALVAGHGRLVDPLSRSSLWRVNASFPINYGDNQLWCGGFGVQYGVNKGKCGVCGEDYREEHPQANENGGKYGRGYIVATYQHASVIEVTTLITANHLGSIQYHVCKIEDSSKPESGEDCFQLLPFEDGSEKRPILKDESTIKSKLRLPKEFSCDHCTLRWTYTAGNNWGTCEDGHGALGCGDQETFRSCADIAIV